MAECKYCIVCSTWMQKINLNSVALMPLCWQKVWDTQTPNQLAGKPTHPVQSISIIIVYIVCVYRLASIHELSVWFMVLAVIVSSALARAHTQWIWIIWAFAAYGAFALKQIQTQGFVRLLELVGDWMLPHYKYVCYSLWNCIVLKTSKCLFENKSIMMAFRP